MSEFWQIFQQNAFVIVIGVCVLAGLVLKSITAIVSTSATERSRREIAAYIAEGTISPEQGERLIRAEVAGQRRA